MPQLGNLVLTDRASTPVNHTFVPRDIVDGVATVEEYTGVPIGTNRVSMSTKRTSGGRYKVAFKGSFPIVQTQTVNGVSTPVVVRTGYFDLSFAFDATSTEQERKDVVGQLYSMLSSSQSMVMDSATKLQAIY